MKNITKTKLDKYISLTEETLKKLKIKKKKGLEKVTKDYLKISKCYLADSKHFYKKGDLVNAFTAINYSHAFLDAGAILGVFDIDDSKYLMVDK